MPTKNNEFEGIFSQKQTVQEMFLDCLKNFVRNLTNNDGVINRYKFYHTFRGIGFAGFFRTWILF